MLSGPFFVFHLRRCGPIEGSMVICLQFESSRNHDSGLNRIIFMEKTGGTFPGTQGSQVLGWAEAVKPLPFVFL